MIDKEDDLVLGLNVDCDNPENHHYYSTNPLMYMNDQEPSFPQHIPQYGQLFEPNYQYTIGQDFELNLQLHTHPQTPQPTAQQFDSFYGLTNPFTPISPGQSHSHNNLRISPKKKPKPQKETPFVFYYTPQDIEKKTTAFYDTTALNSPGKTLVRNTAHHSQSHDHTTIDTSSPSVNEILSDPINFRHVTSNSLPDFSADNSIYPVHVPIVTPLPDDGNYKTEGKIKKKLKKAKSLTHLPKPLTLQDCSSEFPASSEFSFVIENNLTKQNIPRKGIKKNK